MKKNMNMTKKEIFYLMSKRKREIPKENYTFFFKDGYFVTFQLSESDFSHVKNAVTSKLDYVLLENSVIMLTDLRYIAKQEQKNEEPPKSAVPEYLEQDVYEYLRGLERGKAEETGY